MGSLEAKGEGNVKFFLLLVSDSNHTLTNQQFVNCAYLEILSALALLCPVCLTVTSHCLPATGSVQCLDLQYSLSRKEIECCTVR